MIRHRAFEENQETQQAQHDILDRFSKEGTTSIIPIATILGEGRQTEPILITAAGVVVNGNRRSAAMREHYATVEATYSSFSHINCKVLPAAATDKEIKEIEIRLQMQPETRLPYTWVNEALAETKRNRSQLLSAILFDQAVASIMVKSGATVFTDFLDNLAKEHSQVYLVQQRFTPTSSAWPKDISDELKRVREAKKAKT